jgi:hypothetical protein
MKIVHAKIVRFWSPLKKLMVVTVSALFTASCESKIVVQGENSSVSSATPSAIIPAAPQDLRFPSSSLTFIRDTALTELQPIVTGIVSNYSVTPALPTGLSLSEVTGIISGTPSALHSRSDFQIKAFNVSGETSTVISIAVVDPAPTSLSYSSPTADYWLDYAITPNIATTAGGTPTRFSIQPNLPDGLTISETNGAITGTPTALRTATTYTITAENTGRPGHESAFTSGQK